MQTLRLQTSKAGKETRVLSRRVHDSSWKLELRLRFNPTDEFRVRSADADGRTNGQKAGGRQIAQIALPLAGQPAFSLFKSINGPVQLLAFLSKI